MIICPNETTSIASLLLVVFNSEIFWYGCCGFAVNCCENSLFYLQLTSFTGAINSFSVLSVFKLCRKYILLLNKCGIRCRVGRLFCKTIKVDDLWTLGQYQCKHCKNMMITDKLRKERFCFCEFSVCYRLQMWPLWVHKQNGSWRIRIHDGDSNDLVLNSAYHEKQQQKHCRLFVGIFILE